MMPRGAKVWCTVQAQRLLWRARTRLAGQLEQLDHQRTTPFYPQQESTAQLCFLQSRALVAIGCNR